MLSNSNLSYVDYGSECNSYFRYNEKNKIQKKNRSYKKNIKKFIIEKQSEIKNKFDKIDKLLCDISKIDTLLRNKCTNIFITIVFYIMIISQLVKYLNVFLRIKSFNHVQKLRQISVSWYILVWMLTSVHVGAQRDTIINLRQGPVQGMSVRTTGDNREVYAFLGIPYAKPPIRDLRFKAAQEHERWTDTLTADTFGAACPQPYLTGVEISEDCLTLNIWIPE
ncbi:unnamed protein product, partial [Meganyctiphanes norvegica]